ncbi:MAG: carbohydrate kinase family protein [Gemmataceae bacterium]|nr:carbohydrate kinase family protein [Gemmataceae bacterium]MDW8265079.1 carbohydrate kinase family protein [Gemmataceae bacterium]
MGRADVLCAGIVVADHVCAPIDHVPAAGELVTTERFLLTIGGCASNTAVDLVKMGVRAAVVGRVGSDIFGRIVADMLREHGVDVQDLQVSPTAETSQTMIVNVVGEDRRFIHSFGSNAEFRATDIPLDRVRQARVLYLGGYLVMPAVEAQELARVFAAAREAGVRTVLDVAVPGPGDYLPRLAPVLPHVDVFLPNDHEARLITGEADPLAQAEVFRRMGVGTAVITLGAQGAILVNEQVRLKSGVFPVPFVDGSGGGDAFDAGFIFGMLHQMGTEDCLRYASALGASCVRAIGTTPGVFTKAECEDFLRQNALPIERL